MSKNQFLNFVDDRPMTPWRPKRRRRTPVFNVIGRDTIETEISDYDSPYEVEEGSPESNPPAAPSEPDSCSEGASLMLTFNQASNPTRVQTFRVGSCVLPGYTYHMAVYSHEVMVGAVGGDTPSSIASRLAAAINATTAAQWNSNNSAPSPGTPGFKPSASSMADSISVTLNYGNQFAGWAYGSPPAPEPPPPPPAPPPPDEDVEVLPPPPPDTPPLVPDEPPPPEAAPEELAADEPPVAEIAAVSPVQLPNNIVTLDGSGSTDPEDAGLTYAWSQVSGPSSANILTPSSEVTQVTGLQAGNYVFELQVTDPGNNSDTQQIEVVVTAATNLPPIAVAGATQTIYLPTDAVLLDGSGSSDPELGPLTFQWVWIAGPNEPTMINPQKAVARVEGLIEGEYNFRLTVMDLHGETDEAQTKVFVMPPEKELIYKTSIMGGPYMGGGGGGAGGGGGSPAKTATGNLFKPKNLLWLALLAIGVSFIFYKKDSYPK